MAYTGTGTEADPYVVTTLTDILALEGDDIHIKIGADIDASQEEAFKEPRTSAIRLRGHIYADEMRTIANVIVETGYMIDISGGGSRYPVHVENIFFKNWIHRKTGSAATIVLSYGSCNNCCFSLEMLDSAYGYKLLAKSGTYGSDPNVTNCAFYVKFTSGTVRRHTSTNYSMLENIVAKNCTFQFEKLFVGSSAITFNASTAPLTNCTFVGDMSVDVGETTSLQLFKGTTTKVIFALAVTIAEESTGESLDISFISSDSSYPVTYVMVDSDILGENVTVTLSSSTNYSLTTEQMKSEQYLTDIGFLP